MNKPLAAALSILLTPSLSLANETWANLVHQGMADMRGRQGAPLFQKVHHKGNPVLKQLLDAMTHVVEEASPAVVMIVVAKGGAPALDAPAKPDADKGDALPPSLEFFRRFLPKSAPQPEAPKGPAMPRGRPVPPEGGQAPRTPMGTGSGFMVEKDAEGKPLIVTNAHVVAMGGVGGEAKIRMKGGAEKTAKILGYNSRYDLALLRLDESCASCELLPLADSSKVRAGDFVIALGAPFGLHETVTFGNISNIRRVLSPQSLVDDYLQTDAAINPGNSGGPLLNFDGEVVGVNTAIFSPSGTSAGVGFAIPAHHVKALIARFKSTGAIAPAKRMGASIKVNEADEVEVAAAPEPTSPAGKAGLKAGDVFVEIDGKAAPKTTNGVASAIANTVPGKPFKITVRRGGQTLSVTVSLDAHLEEPKADE